MEGYHPQKCTTEKNFTHCFSENLSLTPVRCVREYLNQSNIYNRKYFTTFEQKKYISINFGLKGAVLRCLILQKKAKIPSFFTEKCPYYHHLWYKKGILPNIYSLGCKCLVFGGKFIFPLFKSQEGGFQKDEKIWKITQNHPFFK